MKPSPTLAPLLRLGATAFLSAFLLFQVQPLIAKAFLPWFGGSPAVWTTCMLFFQVLLLGGYSLSALFERLTALPRLVVPLLLLAVAALSLPLTPAAHFRGTGGERPVFELLRLLLLSVGLPYLVLSTTGPLSQAWFRRAEPQKSPYRLYALSNVGSLLSLLTYPVAIEPWLSLRWQTRLWSAGFFAFAVLYAISLWRDQKLDPDPALPTADEPAGAPPPLRDQLLWVLLPLLSSLSLLAVTNHVCQNVAVIPFLWVLPLSLYLLSFIIAFDHERYYLRAVFALGALVMLVVISTTYKSLLPFAHWYYAGELLPHLLALFFVCMLCHGEVVRHKPHPRYLTTFYLYLSAGGALGGLFVSLLAPRIFTSFFEWRIALLGGYVLAGVVLISSLRHRLGGRRGMPAPLALLALLLLPGTYLVAHPAERQIGGHQLVAVRNFYGILRVFGRDESDPDEHDRALFHGTINHGVQFQEGERRHEPITYYGEETGVGRTVLFYGDKPGVRVGVIGLGTGTMAAYAHPGQVFRFYEINPAVEKLARTYFGYLSESRGQVEVALGDARLVLEKESLPPFHVLVVDAFSGDAIPAHLLTREAMDVYLRRLRPDGALAIHVTNRYLDLAPVVRALAAYSGMRVVRIDTDDSDNEHYVSEWMILSHNEALVRALTPAATPSVGRNLLWTDESNDLFRILR